MTKLVKSRADDVQLGCVVELHACVKGLVGPH
jgi:hypothetical protein